MHQNPIAIVKNKGYDISSAKKKRTGYTPENAPAKPNTSNEKPLFSFMYFNDQSSIEKLATALLFILKSPFYSRIVI